ncbi:M1 family metallopeptidase [Allokutzneria multivorans]|uniref:Aminopeptidase N n=1 Tax=Allokutzneria multivorans TaxID=1142134 RepID=A0ABP7RRL4_9PSEU
MLRKHSLRVGAAAAAAIALLAWPAAAGPNDVGAPGIGDEYYPGDGNGGYDVSHYDIRLRYQPADDKLWGTTVITAKPTQRLTEFNLDFAIDPKSVLVNNLPAKFSRTGTELKVTPAQQVHQGLLTTIVVEYEATPSTITIDGQNNWKRTPDGALAVDEPHVSAWWYPSNDHPTDKATFDVSVSVPDGTAALSNGKLAGKSSRAGWTRWNWRSTKPQATYLTFLAVGKYEVVTGTGHKGQPLVNAYGTNLGEAADAAKASIERTPEVIAFLEDYFGDYPFEAQGGVVPSSGLGFALENQTRPVYSPAFFSAGSHVSVVVHELAHQWAGDSVSVAKWRNIWLNEGFASYAEWLWSEAKGEGTAQEIFDHYYQRPAEDPAWQVVTGDPTPAKLFDGFGVYTRGPMALHQLRNAVGLDTFKKILKTWNTDKKYGNATIEQFIALSEKISGKPLYDLFQKWLFTKGKPQLSADQSVQSKAPGVRANVVPKSIAKIEAGHRIMHSMNTK